MIRLDHVNALLQTNLDRPAYHHVAQSGVGANGLRRQRQASLYGSTRRTSSHQFTSGSQIWSRYLELKPRRRAITISEVGLSLYQCESFDLEL